MTIWWLAFAVNTILIVPAVFLRTKILTTAGIAHGWALGVLILGSLGWAGYGVMLFYFVVGSLVTHLGFAQKVAQGIAEKRDGARGPANVWGSAAAAAICALGWLVMPNSLWLVAYVSSMATKLADTTASEIGKAYGKTTYLITTLRPVAAGTEGAVSLEGTLAGLAAGLLVALLGAAVGLMPGLAVPFVVLAALLATTAESLIGATIQTTWNLTNEAVNVINTCLGALLGAGFGWWLRL